ncbi:class I SAM-dependent methyltransferase [Hyphomicrobium album]|uniref:class I SAM-dependent methyltransferase n=1 Tax=Hyphomicrobium album TaxID=2665159 RepID=UPI0012B98564|nr:methyltransferase domain-containing protein [Hyphomicrobium album]
MSKLYASSIHKAGIRPGDTVLVVCGGPYDRAVLLNAGIDNAVISNVDFHDDVTDYKPFEWQRQDAEALTLADACFDWCVVHAGLHHCASPHRALCEMMRVARKGVVVIESRDSALLRFTARLGLAATYELEPAALSDGRYGGYRNTHIPNYVFRWTEREVEKTVRAYAPHEKPVIEYSYGYAIPLQRLSMSKRPFLRLLGQIAALATGFAEVVFPRQGNLFSFVIRRGGELQPWLRTAADGPQVDMDFILRIYDPAKYSRPPAKVGGDPTQGD